MDRKDFIVQVWKKGVVPLLLILVTIFCVRFVIMLNIETETTGFICWLPFLIAALVMGLLFINVLFRRAFSKLKEKLHPNLLVAFKIINKIFDYALTVAIGVLLYHFWIKDKAIVAIFIFLLVIKMIDIISSEMEEAKKKKTQKIENH